MIFAYALDEESHLNGDVAHQSLIGCAVDDRREFRAKTFTNTRRGS